MIETAPGMPEAPKPPAPRPELFSPCGCAAAAGTSVQLAGAVPYSGLRRDFAKASALCLGRRGVGAGPTEVGPPADQLGQQEQDLRAKLGGRKQSAKSARSEVEVEATSR